MSTPEAAATPRGRRPPELVLVAILGIASGVLQLLAGILLIFARYGEGVKGTAQYPLVTLLGAGLVLLGLLTAAVATGLTRGERPARILSTVLLGIGIAGNLSAVFPDASSIWLHLAVALVEAGAIAVMWTGRAARWFRRSSA